MHDVDVERYFNHDIDYDDVNVEWSVFLKD